jgi:hypothetical protein
MAAESSKLTGSAPLLLVADVVKSANYYRDQLGFTYDRFWGEPPRFCMPKRDGLIVMLNQAPAAAPLMTDWQAEEKVWSAYFWCDDVESLRREFVERGAHLAYGPCDQLYGIREIGVEDLDGHRLAFGQPI